MATLIPYLQKKIVLKYLHRGILSYIIVLKNYEVSNNLCQVVRSCISLRNILITKQNIKIYYLNQDSLLPYLSQCTPQ